jgi:DNA-binding CsgD family transcriptional regulator
MVMSAVAADRREMLIESTQDADGVGDVFATASRRLRGLVSFDASVWLATDPATGLPTAPTRSEGLELSTGPAECVALWEREFLVEDVALFRDLARSPEPAAGLHAETGETPRRSPRFRNFLEPNDLGDELRAVLRDDGGTWASVSLFREQGKRTFDRHEVELVASLSAPLAGAVREHARAPLEGDAGPPPRAPGLMVFAPDGELASINDDALVWLEELPADFVESATFGISLPMVVVSTLMRARAIAMERDRGQARARLRSPTSERWLVCHASCLRDAEGRIGNTALVIEPAKGSEVAPIIVQAYELSTREREITELIAQGLGTGQIAERLHLSTHTVRGYVKAVFEKVGVSSRGELVAKLFAEHYAPIHFAPDGFERTEGG